MRSVANMGGTNEGIGASTAPARSISAVAAGDFEIHTASRFSLTSSFVRPVLTERGWSSGSQPGTASSSRFLISNHCSPSSSSKAAPRRRRRADDRKTPAQLLAVQAELQLAVVDGLLRVGCLGIGRERAPVPDDDVAAAVLTLRDDALEVEVLDRVVLDMNGHPAHGRVEARALGDRPRDEHAFDLEAEVVMEPGGAVTLDDEPTRSAAGRAGGLGGLREVALALVFLERHRCESGPLGRR